MTKHAIDFGLAVLLTSAIAMAQPIPPAAGAGAAAPDTEYVAEQQGPPPGGPEHGREGPPPPRANRPPMERAFHGGPPGRWWNNPDMVQKLGLTTDQQKKMDDIFQQSRLRLIDLNASLQKEETIMEPLMAADQPDEGKILSQIDRVAQARAELEKANARMLLGVRRVLNQDQWKKLQAEGPRPGNGPGQGQGQGQGQGPGQGPGRPPRPRDH